MQVGTPPADFSFQLAGYTDVSPEDFVYAQTPGGNWVAAAQDPAGRVYLIDQAGDLYYDSGNPDVGIYAVGTCVWIQAAVCVVVCLDGCHLQVLCVVVSQSVTHYLKTTSCVPLGVGNSALPSAAWCDGTCELWSQGSLP